MCYQPFGREFIGGTKKMKKPFIFALTSILIVLTTTPASALVRYNVTDLGTLGGYEIARAWSVNNRGQIVGFVTQADLPNNSRAVLFDANGTGNNIDLGTLGGQNSSAYSINNHGQIVGAADADPDPSTWYLTVFDPNGSGNNTKLNPDGAAWENNDNGQIVGWIDDGVSRAALFEPDAEPNMLYLGALPGFQESVALSINDSNLIVGFAKDPDPLHYYKDRAVLFDPTGGQNNVDLGSLPGYDYSLAFSVNNNGQIVGRANNLDMSGENWNPRAVLFDPTGDGNNIDLGTLPGHDSAEVFSINNKGQMVGRALINEWPTGSWYDTAVIFDPTGAGNNVNSEDLINPDSGWFLSLAMSINDNGWIVGWGHHVSYPPGHLNAFLLTPAARGDSEPDRDVDLEDFAVLAAAWKAHQGDENYNRFCDIAEPEDGVIDELDLAVFAGNYLAEAP
jgi:uncharacterized membrane protein